MGKKIKSYKNQYLPFRLIFIVSMILSFLGHISAACAWRELAPGLDYQDLASGYLTPWSHIHAFRISLQSNQLSLIMAKDLALPHASVEEYSRYSKAYISVNGGFFDQNYQPLGLRINNNQQESPLKQISWWGIFYIKNNKPYLSNVRQFPRNQPIEFAVQSGPRLIINGKIPPLKPGRAERTSLGIAKDGRVIILITDKAPLSTTELAQLMKAEPLGCLNALNLDGGSSTQLYAKIGGFQLDVHGFSNVSDAVIVKRKE